MKIVNGMNVERELEFVRDREGVAMERMGVNIFRKSAEELGSVYRIGKIRVTD